MKDTVKNYVYVRSVACDNITNSCDTMDRIFHCTHCNYQTDSKKKLKTHINLHFVKINVCQICNFETTRADLFYNHSLEHKDISQVEIFKCSKCDYVSKYKTAFNKHVIIHSRPEAINSPYSRQKRERQCPYCDHKTMNSLKRHISRMHRRLNEVEMFKCSFCEYKTIHKQYLKTHELIHKNIDEVRSYRCDICNYVTKHKRNYLQHSKTNKHLQKQIEKN